MLRLIIHSFCLFPSVQTLMPTALHPACLRLSLPATVTNQMTAQTSRPSKGAQLQQASHSLTSPTGKGKIQSGYIIYLFFIIQKTGQ